MSNPSSNTKEEEIQREKESELPLETIHVDHYGPLPETVDGYKYILVIVDAFTRYTWFCPTRSVTSKETCKKLQMIFNLYGIPKELVSDRGTAFTSQEFAQFLNSVKVKHRKVAVTAP